MGDAVRRAQHSGRAQSFSTACQEMPPTVPSASLLTAAAPVTAASGHAERCPATRRVLIESCRLQLHADHASRCRVESHCFLMRRRRTSRCVCASRVRSECYSARTGRVRAEERKVGACVVEKVDVVTPLLSLSHTGHRTRRHARRASSSCYPRSSARRAAQTTLPPHPGRPEARSHAEIQKTS